MIYRYATKIEYTIIVVFVYAIVCVCVYADGNIVGEYTRT